MLDCVCKHEEDESRTIFPGTDTGPASHGMCSGVDVSADFFFGFAKIGQTPKKFTRRKHPL